MPQSRNANNNLDNESEIVLELLNVVHENSDLTQRSMARELGIALGMANTYLTVSYTHLTLPTTPYV